MLRTLQLTLLLLGSLVVTPSSASDGDLRARFAELAAHQRLSANFQQVQHRSILSMPIESTGRLAFSRPARLMWRVDTPATSIFVMTQGKMGMAYPELGVRQEIDLSKDADAMRLVEAMMVWMDGDYDAVTENYSVSWSPQEDGTAQATLTPTNERLKPMISTITLGISAGPGHHVQRVVIVEPDEDRVEIDLVDIQIDPNLPADTFELPE